MSGYILAIDQGTTSSRAILFDADLAPVASAQREFTQHFPAPDRVEHDPDEIWEGVLAVCREAIARAGIEAAQVAAIGVTNQRETTVLWERESGRPVHRAIVWQDRRTAGRCARVRAEGVEPMIRERTGLLLDPYFSATKLAWLLEHVEGARAAAERGALAFGTIDSWLIWKLTGGRSHATDATNAARTMLCDIRSGRWDPELLELFGVPAAVLPAIRDCADDYGTTDPALLGAAIPVLGVAGDQQAASMGQACFRPGMIKSTYGTGCFALVNTGERLVESRNRLLGTIAARLDGRISYALEGSIFIAGAAVQWLRDGLGIIADAAESTRLAAEADPAQEVYLVPAFTGLGAPWWDAEARGALFGLTRGTGRAEICRAALEAVGFQTRDLIEAMRADLGDPAAGSVLRVDGGMTASAWTMQFLADICEARIERPPVLETTALGAAWLAGMRAGLCPGPEGFAARWRAEASWTPRMDEATRRRRLAGWADAVRRTRGSLGAGG